METDNLIVKQLSAIRNDIATAKGDIGDKLDMLIVRVSSLEGQAAAIHTDLAGVNLRLDHMGARVERMERRLDLADAPPER